MTTTNTTPTLSMIAATDRDAILANVDANARALIPAALAAVDAALAVVAPYRDVVQTEWFGPGGSPQFDTYPPAMKALDYIIDELIKVADWGNDDGPTCRERAHQIAAAVMAP